MLSPQAVLPSPPQIRRVFSLGVVTLVADWSGALTVSHPVPLVALVVLLTICVRPVGHWETSVTLTIRSQPPQSFLPVTSLLKNKLYRTVVSRHLVSLGISLARLVTVSRLRPVWHRERTRERNPLHPHGI